MKTTIDKHEFRQAFINFNRKDQFSYDGLYALFNYLEQYEEDSGEELDLDVIALCCDYTEYLNLEEFQKDYGKDDFKSIEDIEEQTQVIMIDDESFIIQNF